MLSVHIKTIPHNKQRYPTVGDWVFKNGTLEMRISEMSDWRYEFLVAFHEFAEAMICKHQGITQKDVDKFDIKFEQDRKSGKYTEDEEPGDAPKAPYYREHQEASI